MRKLAGIDFDFTGRRFQRIGIRVGAEIFISDKMPVRIFTLKYSHRAQCFIRRQRGVSCQHLGVEIFQPFFLGAALGKLLVDIRPEATGDFAGYPVNRLAFELRFSRRLDEDQIAHIPGVIIRDNVFLFDSH
ncbi:hypothetical protein D3C75_793620 [compost metagenome]